MKVSPLQSYTIKSPSNVYFQKPIRFCGNKVFNDYNTDYSYLGCFYVPPSIAKKKVIDFRIKALTPIKTKSEYTDVLNKILKYTVTKSQFTFNIISLLGYEKIPDEFKGLISYCGTGDISNQINSWLTNRSFEFSDMLPDEKMINVIRAFEYSLNKLDEKYGKFEGKVYRCGYFNPNSDKQYYSTSKSLACAARHSELAAPSPQSPYSIIKVKNGHNIHQFQVDTNTSGSNMFAQSEKEILIDRCSKFKKVPKEEYTQENISDILRILGKTMKLRLSPNDLNRLSKSIDVLNYISVWEEI